MPEIVQGNRKIYYESHGAGDPLILIRGLGSNADHWYAQVPEFSKHYQVITFDNRGIARSGDPGGALTIQEMAADTIALMDALQIERAHVLGLSMGGMIAQEIAINHPQRVRGLVLVVTHAGGDQQVKASDEVIETVQGMTLDDSLEARVKAVAVFFASRTLTDRPDLLQEYAAVSATYPASPEILKRQMEAVANHDAHDRLSKIEAQTLVLTGAEDILIPIENATLLADGIPRSELLVVEGGGHQILVEQPEACNHAVLEFLQKVDATGA